MKLGLFRMLMAFFSGVLVTLFFLVPGKSGPTVLVNGDSQRQTAELIAAGGQIELFGDKALSLMYRLKERILNHADELAR